MARFKSNRKWTLILTLGASLVISSVCYGQAGRTNDPSGNYGPPPPPTSGDPDVPATGGIKSIKPGRAVRSGWDVEHRTVGDGPSTQSVWLWRFRAVWLGLRKQYLGF